MVYVEPYFFRNGPFWHLSLSPHLLANGVLDHIDHIDHHLPKAHRLYLELSLEDQRNASPKGWQRICNKCYCVLGYGTHAKRITAKFGLRGMGAHAIIRLFSFAQQSLRARKNMRKNFGHCETSS